MVVAVGSLDPSLTIVHSWGLPNFFLTLPILQSILPRLMKMKIQRMPNILPSLLPVNQCTLQFESHELVKVYSLHELTELSPSFPNV